MSYSYIKSVFPNFETSTWVEPKNTTTEVKSAISAIEPINQQDLSKTHAQFAKGLLEHLSPVQEKHVALNVETFSDQGCDKFTSHVLECTQCKSFLTKHLNVEQETFRNQENMELISYIVFAIFMLLLMDGLRRK